VWGGLQAGAGMMSVRFQQLLLASYRRLLTYRRTHARTHAQHSVAPNKEECAKNKVDLAYRDYCAHKLVPLNKCRSFLFTICVVCFRHRKIASRITLCCCPPFFSSSVQCFPCVVYSHAVLPLPPCLRIV
jgi:hypothetical protein